MNEIYFTEFLPTAVLGLNKKLGPGFHIPLLVVPNHLPTFLWPDSGLEELIVSFLDQAMSLSHPEKPIRIAIYKRTRLSDIETLLGICPSYWIQLRIDVPSPSWLGQGIQMSLEDTGFEYADEWVTEKGESRLIIYSYRNQPIPGFLLWVQKRKAKHSYSMLLPVHEPGFRV